MRTRAGLIAMIVLMVSGVVAAQPAIPSRPREPSGDTKIPVEAPNAEVMSAETTATSTTAAPVALEHPIDPDRYVCGPGDVFELNFWGQQNFRLRIAVDLEGRTFISKVGFVAASGKTLSVVRADIKKKVRGTYPGLQFDLTLVSPRTFVVHVAENVKSPGAYTATPLDRVSAVLARAGGNTGSKRRISIKHKGGKEIIADLVLYELTGKTEYNPYVLDGDVIAVPFADVVVSISGGVRRAGTYELVSTQDIHELIQLAGGFKSSVVRSLPVRIVHRNVRQQQSTQELAFSSSGTLPKQALVDGDYVIVGDAEDVQRSVLLIGAVAGSEAADAGATTRRLPYVEGDTLRSIIDRVGGIKAPGDLKRSYISRPTKNGRPEIIAVDLEALLVQRDFKADKPVRMNDTIVVPPMKYSVLVEGAVGRAGSYNYNPAFGLSEYIAQAGGRTRMARDLDEVKLVDSNGVTRSYHPSLKPSPGDSILVPERNFSRSEIAQLVLAGAGLLLSGIAITIAVTR